MATFFDINPLNRVYGYYPSVTYQLGLFADHRGFACAVVGLNDEQQLGFAAQVYSDICSGKAMIEAATALFNKYRFTRTNINPLPSLEQILSGKGLMPTPAIVEISDSIFKICVLVNDGKLQIEEDLKDTFESDAANFDPDIVCHRLNALALALVGIDDSRWLTNLLS